MSIEKRFVCNNDSRNLINIKYSNFQGLSNLQKNSTSQNLAQLFSQQFHIRSTDNIKPFLQVSRALPRIDDVTPPRRNHVYIKCKKLQSEAERHAQIERDNFILLKHLNKIMTDKRVDNFWLQENPK